MDFVTSAPGSSKKSERFAVFPAVRSLPSAGASEGRLIKEHMVCVQFAQCPQNSHHNFDNAEAY